MSGYTRLNNQFHKQKFTDVSLMSVSQKPEVGSGVGSEVEKAESEHP